ncbi:hypothetical protein ACFL5F_02295 [Planctomycetota bacterium]
MCKKLSVLASRVSNFRSVTRRPERPPSVIPTSRVLWLVAFAVVWTMTGYGGIAMGQVAGVDDPSDMADSSGDIKRIEAWVEHENLNLTMTVYGVFAPAVEDTPDGMTNRYYYHWLLDTDNNPDTGNLNDQYEGNATNLETPIGADLIIQFGWRDGATNGVYAYDPVAGDDVALFEDYEYTIDGDTIHAVIPLEDLGLEPGQTIAVSAFQEGASNDWQCDWVESFELTLDTSLGQVAGVDDPSDMADSSGDIKRIEAWMDEGSLHLTMTVYGVFAPSVEDTPAGMTNRYYYHWLLDTDNNPDTGNLNDQYEGNATNLETPIGADLIIQFGWRDGATNGVYAYDPVAGDDVALFEDYEYTIEGDTIHAVIPLEDLGLEPGQTIAVSAFQEGASNDWQCDWVESFELTLEDTSALAYNPDPADGAYYTDTWATLGWSPDGAAVSHDVYFGDNYDDVANGTGDTFRDNQDRNINFYIVGFPGYPYPDGLVPGTTYYWRIDEVNEADPRSPWKGNVWSFTIPPTTAYNPDPADGAEFVDPNAALSWTPGYGAKTHTVYLGDNYEEVDNAADGTAQVPATYNPGTLEREKVYYWRVDEFDAASTYKGDIWSFTTPGAVGNPNPSNGAVDVKMTTTLSWTPADSAASHEIYFGEDKDAVRNADENSPEYKGNRASGSESFDPIELGWNSTWYWRVDAVYSAGLVKGLVWSFTVADFLLVDDFEDYDTGDNQIWYAWRDGLGYGTPDTPPYSNGNGTGSAVGDETTPSYCEEKIVHGGGKSMPVLYDNNKQGYAMYSEVEMTLSEARDWTDEGVGTLTIWFRGILNNDAERMYVALSNQTGVPVVVYHDDPAATQIGAWTEWVILLQSFADQGIDLTDINKIAFGIGTQGNMTTPGGSGKMLFDDIRLYRSSELPE